MSRILIDLTDLELWNGVHGGTQRVVYGIAKHYFLQRQNLKHEVVFMAFAKNKAFRTTRFEPIYERVQAAQKATGNISHSAVTIKSRVKQRLYPFVPSAVHRNPTIRKAAHKSYSLLNQARKSAGQAVSKRRQSAASEKVVFRPDDVVLILGKPWDNPNIQSVLTTEKSKTNFKIVQMVYDLIICLNPHLHHPSLFTKYTRNMFEAVSNSDAMLAISESSKKDLKRFCNRLNLPVPPTTVVRLGDELDAMAAKPVKPDRRIDKQFIACVGTVEIRKNHTLLYNAYKLAQEQNIDLPQLVIVGSKGWLTGDFQYLVKHDPDIKGKILILNNVSDAGLRWVYQNSLFTVYPSMYEGWGLPVAESLAFGKSCVAANDSSIPEIAGDLIDYFSPYSAQECLDKLTSYLDPEFRDRKDADIKKNYTITTWEQTFQACQRALDKLDKPSKIK